MRLPRYTLWWPQVRILAFLGLTFGCLTAGALTTPSPTRDDLFYYEIGGAQAVSPPASRFSSVPVRGSLELGLRYSCGNFDPILGIATQLEQIIDRVETLVLNAITASIAALPMYILERANPGLYDLLQNLLIKAEGVIDLANVTCEQMEREIAQGQNPYERWRQLAKGYRWKVNMGNQGWQSSEKDVKSALDDVEQVGGDDGIVWIAGARAGGVGQPPINVIGDVAVAGYNLLLGRPAGDTSTPAALDPQHRIVEIWKTPGELRAWVNQVLGEISIHTNEAPPDAMAGTGLLKRVQESHDEVLTNLAALVSGPASDLTVARLGEVSAAGLALTRAAIEAVQAMAPIERDIVLQKLAAEIALARVVEEALLARRAFLAGRHEPHVAGSPAFEENQIMDRTLAELNREIDDLVFEARIRREVVSDTLTSILRLEESKRLHSARTSETPVRDPNPVEGGAVKP